MKVKELIELLKKEDPDAMVYVRDVYCAYVTEHVGIGNVREESMKNLDGIIIHDVYK